MFVNTQSIQERINALTPRLRRIAAHNVGSGSEHTAEDLFQTICLKLLERCAEDPAFAARSDAELLIFAEWRSRSKAESGRVYSRYVRNDELISADDGEAFELDLVADDENVEERHIERETLEAIEQVIRSLDPRNQQIVYLLYQGYSQVEIAAALQITKGAVSQRKSQIAAALQSAGI